MHWVMSGVAQLTGVRLEGKGPAKEGSCGAVGGPKHGLIGL